MAAPLKVTCAPPWPLTRRPSFALPSCACDTHCHVFGPVARFPYAEDRSYTPPEAPSESLYSLHDALGVDRAVIVHPNCHGVDMAVTLDAIAGRPDRYRGIALVEQAVSEQTLTHLHEGGIRGIRFNFVPHLGPPPDLKSLERLADWMKEASWHLVAHTDAKCLDAIEPLFSLGIPAVIDHMARLDASFGPDDPATQRLETFVRRETCWIKVSGADRVSKAGPPYTDAVALARRLIAAAPDRVLWGTDWPHPNHGAVPDDADLIDLVPEIAPDPDRRRKLLVDNPARLYGFVLPQPDSST